MVGPGSSDLFEDDDGGATILDDGLSICDEERSPHRHITSGQAAALRADSDNDKCQSRALLFFTFLLRSVNLTRA